MIFPSRASSSKQERKSQQSAHADREIKGAEMRTELPSPMTPRSGHKYGEYVYRARNTRQARKTALQKRNSHFLQIVRSQEKTPALETPPMPTVLMKQYKYERQSEAE
jgi:hypothetical protein